MLNRIKKFFAVSFVLSPFLASCSAAETIPVAWFPGSTYDDRTVNVGDTVVFNYGANLHDVFLHQWKSCDRTNSVWVGNTPPTAYTFNAPGEYTFACQVANHCEAGQIITFNVIEPTVDPTSSPTRAPSPAPLTTTPAVPLTPETGSTSASVSPAEPPSPVRHDIAWEVTNTYADQIVNLGDSVRFTYINAHTVSLLGGRNCDFANSQLLGGPVDSPVDFEFTEVGEYTFGCSVPTASGTHCNLGQRITFTAPTQSPSPSPVTAAKTFEIGWTLGRTYEDVDVTVGDIAIFVYAANHNVFLHAEESCDRTGSTLVGGNNESPLEVVFDTPGRFVYACQVGNHCDQGMIIAFNVRDPDLATTHEIDWALGVQYDDLDVTVGDIGIFQYTSNHNVFLHAQDSCDRTGSTLVGSNTASPLEVVFDTPGTFVYACQVGNHCDQGMKIVVNVREAGDDVATTTTTVPPPAGAQTIPIEWLTQSYADRQANVGDTVVFAYGAAHDVHLHQDKSCDTTDSQLLGDTTASPVSFTFPADGEYTFACQQGTHCVAAGQRITFTVGGGGGDPATPTTTTTAPPPAAGETIDIAWSNTEPYADRQVSVGDKVTFTYSSNHNVFLHPSQSCNTAGSTQIGGNGDSPVTFDFDEAGTFTFACQVGNHCEGNSQIITFIVGDGGGGGPSSSFLAHLSWTVACASLVFVVAFY